MREKQDKKEGKSVEDLRFELIFDGLMIYDVLLHRRPT